MSRTTGARFSLVPRTLVALASIASYALFASIEKMIRQLEAAPDMGGLFVLIAQGKTNRNLEQP